MIKAAILCSWIFCHALLSQAQPTISFTFDDGVTQDMPGYTFEEWNSMLLSHLDRAQVKAVFFATGFNKLNNKGKSLLQSWNTNGIALRTTHSLIQTMTVKRLHLKSLQKIF